MRRSKFLGAGLLVAAATLCNGALAQSAEEAAPPAAPAVSAETPVATVDGVPITVGELISARRALPPELQRYPDEFLLRVLIEQLRDQQLLAAAARAQGLDETKLIRLALINIERAALADAFMADALLRRVTRDEIQRVYQERYVDAEPVEEVRAAHIVVDSEAKARGILEELSGGADFAAIAGRASIDETASQGGALGWFARGEMAPAFAKAAFDLSEGAVSEPVKSPYGWHLIKLDGRRTRPVPPLEDVSREIIGELSEAAQAAVLAELRAAATLKSMEAEIPPTVIRQDTLIAEEAD